MENGNGSIQVRQLLRYANEALAGKIPYARDLYEIISTINEYFNTCRKPCEATKSRQGNAEYGRTSALPSAILLSTYPNPVSDQLSVVLTGEMKTEVLLELYNANGRLVRSERMEGLEGRYDRQWDLSDLPSGLYGLNVRGEGDLLQSVKIIKQQFLIPQITLNRRVLPW